MFEIGLSTCGKTVDDRFFASCAEAGIGAVEISPGHGEFDGLEFPPLRRMSDTYGVRLNSLHLPFYPFDQVDISALDASIRKATVEKDEELIRRAADIGIKLFVIHPGGEPVADDERAERLMASAESLARLAPVAKAAGAALAIEDLPRTCPGRDSGEIASLLEVDPSIRVCFDTNHLLREPIKEFIEKLGDRIATTHVSDYDGVDEKHWLPGEGIINWRELRDSLAKAGYRGVWLYELGFSAPRTISRPRDLTPFDFVRNAREIFEDLPITVLGRPNR